MSAPYTHADHAKACVVAYYKGEALGIKTQYVQARIGRTVCCAKLVTAWDTADGLEMWQLDLLGPIHGRMSAPSARVRKCSGVDGTCSCAPVDFIPVGAGVGGAPAQAERDGAPTGAALQLLPDGNHGDYFPECAE